MTAALIVAVCFALLAYFLIGYPLLLAMLGKRLRPVNKAPILPRVAVIIPVHNGGKFLAAKLRSVLALDYPRELIEITVVSDGSTDDTESVARSFPEVSLLTVPRGGKPAALNAAIPRTSHEILLLTDVRQTLAPESLRRLVANFSDPKVGVVSGRLIIRRGDSQDQADIGLYWRLESWIREQLSNIDSMFGATGPFYAIRRELVVSIPPVTLLDDMYLPLSAFRRGYRLIVEESAEAYDYPTSRDTEFRRKVRTLAGNYQLLRLCPWLLGPANRMWFHFVSYKLGRLLMPYLLIVIAAASPFLPYPFNWLLLGGQAFFYGLAAADPLIPSGSLLRKLSSPIRTFVVMMAAALIGVSVFFRPPQSLWRVTTNVGAGKSA